MVEEWLDAEAITGNDDLAVTQIQQHQCPHAVQSTEATAAPPHIGRKNDLGVADRGEAMTELSELARDFPEIVDLAVEHQPYGSVGRRHRLRGYLARILDLQPAERHSHAQIAGHSRAQRGRIPDTACLPLTIEQGEAFAIRAAMRD